MLMISIGLAHGTVGMETVAGYMRYTFKLPALAQGIDFLPVAMGLFGISEVLALGGTVYRSDGVTPVPTAMVQVRRSGTLVRTVYTGTLGTFTVGSLRPGSYTLTVTKTGFVFPVVPPVTLGPSNTTLRVVAISPLLARAGR